MNELSRRLSPAIVHLVLFFVLVMVSAGWLVTRQIEFDQWRELVIPIAGFFGFYQADAPRKRRGDG